MVLDTDHQALPCLCREAVLYNRLTEMGLTVRHVRFPAWGAAVSCIITIEYPRQGFVNDALMQCMGAPWLNTEMVKERLKTRLYAPSCVGASGVRWKAYDAGVRFPPGHPP